MNLDVAMLGQTHRHVTLSLDAVCSHELQILQKYLVSDRHYSGG